MTSTPRMLPRRLPRSVRDALARHLCTPCRRLEDPVGAYAVCWAGCGHVFRTAEDLDDAERAYWPQAALPLDEITDCPLCCTPFGG